MLVDTVRSDVHDCCSYKEERRPRSRRPDIETNVCGWTKFATLLYSLHQCLDWFLAIRSNRRFSYLLKPPR